MNGINADFEYYTTPTQDVPPAAPGAPKKNRPKGYTGRSVIQPRKLDFGINNEEDNSNQPTNQVHSIADEWSDTHSDE